MTSRDRVIATMELEESDRVPTFYWTTRESARALHEYLRITEPERIPWVTFPGTLLVSEQMLRRLGVDFRMVYAKPPGGFTPKTFPDGSFTDEFGIVWKKVGLYVEFVQSKAPLADMKDPDELDNFPWPDPEDDARFEGVEKWAKRVYEETEYAIETVPLGGPMAVVELAWMMRGLEQFLKDLYMNQRFLMKLIDILTDFNLKFESKFLDAVGQYTQLYRTGGDVGSQSNMLFSPELWRKFFKPCNKKIFDNIHRRAPQAKILYHGDGAMRPIIPDLIEIGVDVLNPIQPLAKGMDSESIKRDFGGKICFHGAIDLQRVMSSRGSIKEVEEEVKHRIKVLAPGGGYILGPAHNIQADSLPEKILALYDSALKYGSYPIRVD